MDLIKFIIKCAVACMIINAIGYWLIVASCFM